MVVGAEVVVGCWFGGGSREEIEGRWIPKAEFGTTAFEQRAMVRLLEWLVFLVRGQGREWEREE